MSRRFILLRVLVRWQGKLCPVAVGSKVAVSGNDEGEAWVQTATGTCSRLV